MGILKSRLAVPEGFQIRGVDLARRSPGIFGRGGFAGQEERFQKGQKTPQGAFGASMELFQVVADHGQGFGRLIMVRHRRLERGILASLEMDAFTLQIITAQGFGFAEMADRVLAAGEVGLAEPLNPSLKMSSEGFLLPFRKGLQTCEG